MSSELPEGWIRQPLGQAARIVTGKTPSTKDDRFWNGDVPFVTPSDIGASPWCEQVERHLTELGASTVSNAPAGAILYTCIASIGKSCIIARPSAFNQQINACIPGPSTDSYFLYGLLQAMSDEIKQLAGTTAIPIINKTTFSNILILLPPVDEQRRIAEVLRSVDEAIAAAQAAAYMAENLLVRVRDAIISQPIWDTTSLSDATLAGLFTDGDWVESKDQDPDGEVRLIQLADIGDGCFVDKSRRYLTMGKARQLRCTFLKEGDLLIARMPDPLGRCCLFPAINQPSVTVVDVCVVRASQITSNRYLNHALATSEFRSQVLACASGTTRTRVSRGNLGQLELAMPPLAEQNAIADELDQISIVANGQRQAAEQLRDLKQGLMSDLLSGHVRVPA